MVSHGYPPPRGRSPTCYSPVRHFTCPPKRTFTFDLHVLGTPPAFILSQDQTLHKVYYKPSKHLCLLNSKARDYCTDLIPAILQLLRCKVKFANKNRHFSIKLQNVGGNTSF